MEESNRQKSKPPSAYHPLGEDSGDVPVKQRGGTQNGDTGGALLWKQTTEIRPKLLGGDIYEYTCKDDGSCLNGSQSTGNQKEVDTPSPGLCGCSDQS